jgi:hypothetical protein
VTEGGQRCFIEDVAPDTLIITQYKNPDFVSFGNAEFTGRGVKATILDPNKVVILTRGLENKVCMTYIVPRLNWHVPSSVSA